VSLTFLNPHGFNALTITSNDVYLYASKEFVMRTTLNLDDSLLEKAGYLTGMKEKAALVREGLKALIERESARRLARLGGSESELAAIPRRQTGKA